jgi:hypothetical protein
LLINHLVSSTSPRLDIETVFIGASFDDLRLMAAGRLFCTGEIDFADLSDIVRLYQISHLLIADESASDAFDAYNEALGIDGLAIARIVPAAEGIMISGDGLLIPSGASISAMANALNGWTAQYLETAHG